MAEIQNPNQSGGGGQDSRTLLIFAVIFVAAYFGMHFFVKKPADTTQTTPAASSSPAPVQNAGSSPSSSAPPAGVSAPAAVAAASETKTVVENDLYRITFSNRGGQAVSWILKRYKDADAKNPLDLVNGTAAAKYGYPLSLWTNDAALRAKLATALFVPSATGTIEAPGSLTFTYSDGSLTVKKVFTFDSSYVLHAEASATENGRTIPVAMAWPSGFGDQTTPADYSQGRVNSMVDGKADDEAAKKVNDGSMQAGSFDWAGASDLYFGAIFLPDVPAHTTLVSLKNQITIPKDSKPVDVLGAAVGAQDGGVNERLFVGPKVIAGPAKVLNSIHATAPDGRYTGPSIEPIVNFGIWGFIAKPLFLLLFWVHDHVVANWGWAILVLTIFITMAMLPARIKMMKSSLNMQRIQPEMNTIREKYKKYKTNDPRRADMNKEIFDLQKREGVNMFGGCLPMLLQYPLLYGFYKMLEIVIELRQAHWYWLHNLAAPDPIHILPIFFIVSMFLVQYLTPSPGMDPTQQRMMAFTMPLFFGFMTWSLPSGLTLYWACSNIINIVQQAVMNRTGMGRQMRELAAKRAAKKAGQPLKRKALR
ncbi:MAG TPA: membrane protein insertase YidC [Acidobacteriaceae bacterium]|nr:membrane protein insertase YidC [Acidobacteriaceae bacterium]